MSNQIADPYGGKEPGDSEETLPLDLNRLVVSTRCPYDFGDLPGSQRVRFCSQCQRNVYNLSKLTRPEIIELIQGGGERICGRLYRRPDGTIVTAQCPSVAPSSQRSDGSRSRFKFTIAHVLALMTMCAAAFAAVPWVGRKVDAILSRWAPPPTPANTVNVGLDWEEGEIEILEEDLYDEQAFQSEPGDTML